VRRHADAVFSAIIAISLRHSAAISPIISTFFSFHYAIAIISIFSCRHFRR